MAQVTWVQSQVELYQRQKKKKKKKMVLDYKVQIKGKVEQSRERSSALA